MKPLFSLIIACFLIWTNASAQLVANGNSGQTTTSYTNGSPNNPIYIWCGTTLGATNGSLTATPTSGIGGPFTFEWFYHDQATSSWVSFNTTTGASSTMNNLASDGYRVEVRNSSGVTVNCFIAWVWNLNTVVTANATAAGCNANLTGTVNTNGSFTYYNPPPPESIITSSTNITVCFSATHTFVSDLAFYLVGPPSCGSPTVVLSPNPGAIGQGSVCNSGDNVTNLCFSRTSTNNLNICTATAPLTGTYGTYGPSNTAINWNAFNGCNAAQGGWAVQIYDCIGADVGALTNATVTFSNLQSICGSPTSISYTSGAINSAINDNSCSAATASIFQVPVANNLVTPITLNATTSVLWTASPAVSIAAPTSVNTTASGLPNGTTTFTLTATTSFGGTSCVSSASSAVNVVAPVVNAIPNQTHCPGVAVPSTAFSSTPAGATYAWTNNNTAIGLGASGTGNLPAFTATNATSSAITSTISVTPTLAGCTGAPTTFTITVNPRPTVNAITPIVQCAGTTIPSTTFASTPAGATFAWSNNNTSIGLGASGTGNQPSFTATNTGSTNIVATITVTPTLNGCTGTASTYTITIKPIPTVTVPAAASYCPGAAIPAGTFTTTPAGGTTAWNNSNTAIGLGVSGTGNQPAFTAAANNSGATISGTISVTPTVSGCTGTPVNYTISIFPTPSVDANPDLTACNNGTVASTAFTSTPAGATFGWTNSNTAIGLGASGTGNQPSFTATNAGSTVLTGSIVVTPTLNGCIGVTDTYVITVNPTPVANVPANIAQCGGNVSPAAFTSTPAGSTFTWTNSNTAIGLGASGSGNIATFVGTNGGSTPITGTIAVTPTLNGCIGIPSNFTITINPTPIISTVTNATACHNQTVSSVTPVVVPGSATVSWSNNNTSIGLGASGTGTIPSFTATNAGSTIVTSTITLNATAAGCNAVPVTYTITVNPLPTVNAITPINQCNGTAIPSTTFASTPAGSTFTWTNSNTAIGLGGSGSGDQPAFTGTNATASTINGTITVTPTLNGCVGTNGTYTISILPSPTVIVPANANYCPNLPVPASSFTTSPVGGTVAWSNSNTAIGLGASGTGNIPGFTSGANNGTSTISGTITVTPTVAGCVGTPSNFTIGIFPTPTVDPITPITVCNGANVSASNYSSTPAGASFTWSNNTTSIGLAASGSGNQPAFLATNNGSSAVTATVTVTPTLNGCVGNTGNYTITVNPTPIATVPANITQCVSTVTPPAFISTPAGATFTWTNTNTGIGLAASGNGDIAAFQGTNTGSTPISGVVSVTPTLNTCVGTPVNFSITINPTPVIGVMNDIVDCEGAAIPVTSFNVTPSSATVSWNNSNTNIGLGANGTGNVPAFVMTNNTLSAITGTVSATASENGCTSAPVTFDITVNQLPVADPVSNVTQCDNTTVNSITFTSTTPGVSFDWTNSNTAIGLVASGNGNLPTFTTTNPTTTASSGTITVTPSLGTCVGSPINFTIAVNPVPVPVVQNNGPLCPGETLNLSSTGLPGATYSWTGPDLFTSSIQNPSITAVATTNGGVYNVTVDAAGCIGTASTTLVINPMVAPNITQVGPYCSSDNDEQLVASLPGGTWSGTGIVNPASGQFAPTVAGAGSHTITYTVNAPCSLPATTTIVVNPLPVVNLSAPILSGCEPFTATFTDQSLPASNSVVWDFGDGNTSSQTGSVSHTFNAVGCYDITLTSTSTAGCVNTTTLPNYICVNPYADANFTTDNATHTVIDPSFNFFNNSTNATVYSWDFGDGTGSSEVNPTHTYVAEPGSYTIMLAATNQFGCPDTTYMTVVVNDQLIFYVPNSFTPDGDEHNNMFEPVFYSGFDPQSYTFLIFDRWGEIIFESHDVTQGWHGTYLDGTVKEGVYTWLIQFKVTESDKKLTQRGHVTLLK